MFHFYGLKIPSLGNESRERNLLYFGLLNHEPLEEQKQVKLYFDEAMTEYDYEEIQDMIDSAIAQAMRRHNRNASLISACLGLTVLAFYSHGLITVVDRMKG